ncbi:G-protein coupled receptor family C group 6 member A-like [Clytia hemisphaerica]|uniref:G-protein coupled receptor family C group 6 member A-like n=1 Tax=Clytia hemisphaerica TaxID=252671 RepID=UPI0034D7B846
MKLANFYILLYSSMLPLCDFCLQQLDFDQHVEPNNRFYIIGFAPLRSTASSSINTFGLVAAEAIKYAVHEANEKILSNDTRLSYIIFDDCGEAQADVYIKILEYLLVSFTSDCQCKPYDLPLGTVGPYSSASSKLFAEISSSLNIPMISYQATSIELNNQEHYPTFFRTIPDDGKFASMIVNFLQKHNWTYVSLIASDNSYGWHGRNELHRLFKENNICTDIDALFSVPYQTEEILSILRKVKGMYKAKVVILFASNEATQKVLQLASSIELYSLTWFFTDGSSLSESLTDIDHRVVKGSFTALAYAGEYKPFYEHFWNITTIFESKWAKQYFLENDLKWKPSSHFKSVFNVPGFIRQAVFTYAHNIKQYVKRFSDLTPFNSSLFVNDFLKETSFQIDKAVVEFDTFGNIKETHFVIMNVIKNKSLEVVGDWYEREGFIFQKDIEWATSAGPPNSNCAQACEAGLYPVYNVNKECCWICVPCMDGFHKEETGNQLCSKCSEGASNEMKTECLTFRWLKATDHTITNYFHFPLVVLTIILVLFCMIVWSLKKTHPVVKASNFKLSISQLSFQFILPVSTAILQLTENDDYSCVYKPLITANGYLVIVALLSIRAELLVKAFRASIRQTRQDVLIIKSVRYGMVFSTVAFNVSLVLIVISFQDLHVFIKHHPNTFEKEMACANETLIYLQLIFIMAAFILCGSRAYQARHLPNKFNESRCIILAILINLLFICIFFFLVASTEKKTLAAAFIATFLCIGNFAIFVVTFGPKLFDILFDKKLNDKKRFQDDIYNNAVKRVDKKMSTVSFPPAGFANAAFDTGLQVNALSVESIT